MRSPIKVVYYDGEDDSVVVRRLDGTEERHPCGSTTSDAKRAEVCALALEEQPTLQRVDFGLRAP